MANNIKLEDYQEIRALAKQLLADRDELDGIFNREDQNATRRHDSIWNSKGSDRAQESYNNLRGNYAEALDEFKLGNDRNNYSRTYKLYRDDVIRSNFTWVVTIIVVLLILLIVWKKYGKQIKARLKAKKGGDQ